MATAEAPDRDFAEEGANLQKSDLQEVSAKDQESDAVEGNETVEKHRLE